MREVKQFWSGGLGLRAVAPDAVQRAAFQVDRCANAWAVMYGKMIDIRDQTPRGKIEAQVLMLYNRLAIVF